MATRAIKKKPSSEGRVAEEAKASQKNEGAEGHKGRNIAVAYEPVDLTEEDAEILRRVRENHKAQVGRPARPPRKMADR